MQTLPEEFFMCKSATRQKARGGAAFRGCSLDTPVQPYGQGHLCFCNLTLKLVFILYPKEIEGNCLKLVKGTGKKKKKKGNVSAKCNNAQLTHPGLCFFSPTPKNY